MKSLSAILLFLSLVLTPSPVFASEVNTLHAKQAQQVSLISLVANPDVFEGKRVQVFGFMSLEYENKALYFDREAFNSGGMSNAVWIEISPGPALDRIRRFDNRYVVLEGDFSARDSGHLGFYSGSLKNVGSVRLAITRSDLRRDILWNRVQVLAPRALVGGVLLILMLIIFVWMRRRRARTS